MQTLSSFAPAGLDVAPAEMLRGDAQQSRVRLSALLERLATAQVLFAATTVVVAFGGLVLGHPLGAWVLPLASVVSIVAFRALSDRWADAALIGIATGVLHAVAGLIGAAFPDGSWDGLAYHQEAILRLAKGWNPVFEGAAAYGDGAEIYLDHYPKGPWLAASAVLLSTGHVEAGKLFNLTLAVAAGGLVVCALLRLTTLPRRTAVIVGILTTLNPVFISQSTTFYVDGMLGSLLTILVAALAMYVSSWRWQSLAVALLATCLLINVKFTGLVYAVVLMAAAVAIVWSWHGWRAAARMAVPAGIVGIVGTLVVGYAPYVRNTVEHGAPFYSVSPGPAHRPDLLQPQRPANLVQRDRFTRFLVSNFSRSEAVRPPDGTHLKFPFWIRRDEQRALYGADLESGGFGPLFGALLLLTAAGVAALTLRPATRPAGSLVLLIGGCILASIFVHSETWWARFVPQAWLLPMLVATAGLTAARRSLPWWLGCSIVCLTVANVLVISVNVGWRQWNYARLTRSSLHEMAASPTPLTVYLVPFASLRQRLSEAGVAFTMVDTPPAEPGAWRAIPAPGNRALWSASLR